MTTINGCTATATSTVTLDDTLPSPTLTASDARFCSGNSVTFTAGGGFFYHFKGSILDQASTSTMVLVSQGGSYSVTVSGSNGCTAVSGPIAILEDLPITGFAITSETVCPGLTATLQASGCAGGVIQWPDGRYVYSYRRDGCQCYCGYLYGGGL